MKRNRTSAGNKSAKSKRSKLAENTDLLSNDMDTSSDSRVDNLMKEVSVLLQTVSELKNQVQFLLSALGWTMPRAAAAAADGSAFGSQEPTAGAASQSADQSTGATSSQSSQYSDAVQRSTINLQRNIRDAVVAAVYVDQNRKDSRATNVVVSGLPSVPQVADKSVVIDLCRNELGVEADVVHCKRLGKVLPGRAQPLLVVLRSADQADQIMARARNLRKSKHDVVQQNVFINRHMTAAEARAAYDMRCQRRLAAERRNQKEGSAAKTSAASSSKDDSTTTDVNGGKSTLSANAVEFSLSAAPAAAAIAPC